MKSKNGNIDDSNNLGYDKSINLTPLKILIFLFFGALQCAFTYLPNQMIKLGLNSYDVRMTICLTSIVSILGVLLVAWILDLITRKNPGSIGKWIKFLLILSLLGTAISYALLAFYPIPSDDPTANNVVRVKSNFTFACDQTRGYLMENKTDGCQSVDDILMNLQMVECFYQCKNQRTRFKRQVTGELDYDDSSSNSDEVSHANLKLTENPRRSEEYRIQTSVMNPHICHNETSQVNCHVYLEDTVIRVGKVQASQEPFEVENVCHYPLDGFSCRIPDKFVKEMSQFLQIDDCDSDVECSVIEEKKSKPTEYRPLYEYYILVTVAEMFPAIVILLIIVAMLIATREMETTRGNISRQWIFFPLGILIFSTILGVLNHCCDTLMHFIPFITLAVVSVLCALVVFIASSIFSSPSNWWWHTKCGMLAVPMSSLKRYRWLIFSFSIVCLFTGIVWNVMESYRQIILVDIIEDAINNGGHVKAKTFVYIIGAITAFPLILCGEKIVDMIGHPFLMLLALISFAIRFSGLSLDYNSPCNSFYELLDPFSFYLSWFGYLLIIRHFIPKKYLCFGSAIFVSIYFLLGRAIGFYSGISTDYHIHNQSHVFLYYAVITVFVSTLFFAVYCCLDIVKTQVNNDNLTNDRNYPDVKSQQRVFHDERSKKGYFRY